MDTGEVRVPSALPRHFAVDERGVGLRATWHPEHGFVNVSLWSGDRCVQTFRLTPVEAGRLVGYLAGVLAEAVPAPRPHLAAVPALPQEHEVVERPDRLDAVRRQVSAALDRAARLLRP
jgi:hypothetical protein